MRSIIITEGSKIFEIKDNLESDNIIINYSAWNRLEDEIQIVLERKNAALLGLFLRNCEIED